MPEKGECIQSCRRERRDKDIGVVAFAVVVVVAVGDEVVGMRKLSQVMTFVAAAIGHHAEFYEQRQADSILYGVNATRSKARCVVYINTRNWDCGRVLKSKDYARTLACCTVTAARVA